MIMYNGILRDFYFSISSMTEYHTNSHCNLMLLFNVDLLFVHLLQACGMDVKKKQKRLNATVAQMGDGRSVQDELSANVETSKALVSAATSEVAAAEEQSRREIHGMDIHAQTQIDVTTTLSRAMISQVRGLTPATVPLSVVRIASSMLLLMFPDQVRVAEDAMAKLAVPDEAEAEESDIDPLLEKALVDWEVRFIILYT